MFPSVLDATSSTWGSIPGAQKMRSLTSQFLRSQAPLVLSIERLEHQLQPEVPESSAALKLTSQAHAPRGSCCILANLTTATEAMASPSATAIAETGQETRALVHTPKATLEAHIHFNTVKPEGVGEHERSVVVLARRRLRLGRLQHRPERSLLLPAGVLILHPYALLGGSMADYVVSELFGQCAASPEVSVVVKYNQRGVGRSSGSKNVRGKEDAGVQ